jgi:hypothetical protein
MVNGVVDVDADVAGGDNATSTSGFWQRSEPCMRCASALPEVAGFPKNPHPAAHRVGSCCCSICDLSPSILRGNGVVPDCRMRPRERGWDDQLSARTKQTVTSTGQSLSTADNGQTAEREETQKDIERDR